MKDTNDLRQELMDAADLDRFLSANHESFHSGNAGELLQRLFRK